jgi:hypothetical protein
MNNMLEFKKEDFDAMLHNDKKKIVEMLKDADIIKIYYSQQRFFYYKVFHKQLDDLFIKKDDESILDKNTKPLILHDIDFSNKNIYRESFRFWYFIGNEINFYKAKFYGHQTNFSASIFHVERIDFFAAEFRSERTDFSAVEFYAKETLFSEAQFYGRQTYFLGAHFYSSQADFSKVEFHGKQTDFSKAEFFCKRLLFAGSDFYEYVNFAVNNFAEKNSFANAIFRIGANIDIKKLCDNEEKLSKPIKLDLDDCEKTIENLHTIKRLLKQNEKYDEEDHILYWYKVYERRANKKIVRKILFPFEWLFLDKMTGYFAKVERAMISIVSVLILFFIIYSSAVIIDNKSFGNLIINNSTLSANFVNTELSSMEKFRIVFGNILYFDLITYTTIGYGDILPAGFLKIIAGIEGLTGTLLNALFLIILTKKILR